MRRLLIGLLLALSAGTLGSVALVGTSLAVSNSANEIVPSNSASNIIVQPIVGPSVADTVAQRTKQTWPWYVTRASGLVAAAALIILMLSGIGLVTGSTFKFLEPLTAWASHRALGLTFGIAVLVHIGSILFDHFVSFSLLQLLVPWLSNYKPVTLYGFQLGSLWVALGILAFYGAILVTITSLLWVEKKPHLWKLVHFLSYAVILLVFVHALYLGTDLLHGVLRWLWIAGGLAIIVAVLARLRRANTS